MNPDSLFDAAYRARAEGRNNEASALCATLLSTSPWHFGGLNLYGTLLAEQGNLTHAKEVLSQAAAVSPDSPESQTNLGSVYLLLGQEDMAREHFEEALRLDPKSADAAFNLAEIHRRCGRLVEARQSLLQSIEARPRFARAHRFLAELLEKTDIAEACRHMSDAAEIEKDDPAFQMDAGNFFYFSDRLDAAATCFARVPPEHAEYSTARFMLAAVRGETPESAPRSYIQAIFDGMAPKFDSHLQLLSYTAPEALAALHAEIGGVTRRAAVAVDFGCGTGLSGMPFRSRVDRLIGVDFSPGMIELARQRGIYDDLVVADALEYLARPGELIDLFLAADVFIYVGALDRLFAAWARRASPGALALFSIEKIPTGTFVLQPTQRYAHSQSYIEEIAAAHGFSVAAQRDFQIRKERGAWLPGHLFALKKSG